MIQIIITLKQTDEADPAIAITVVDTDGSATEKEVESAQQLTEALTISLELGELNDRRGTE